MKSKELEETLEIIGCNQTFIMQEIHNKFYFLIGMFILVFAFQLKIANSSFSTILTVLSVSIILFLYASFDKHFLVEPDKKEVKK